MHDFVLAALVQDTPQTSAPVAGATPQTTAGPGADAQGTTEPGPPETGPGGLMQTLGGFVPFLLIIAIFYFLMIAPERKQRKKRDAMLAAVKKGDKVVTTGGMFATVAAVNEDSITLQVSDDVRMRFSRAAVAQVLDNGSEASAKG